MNNKIVRSLQLRSLSLWFAVMVVYEVMDHIYYQSNGQKFTYNFSQLVHFE